MSSTHLDKELKEVQTRERQAYVHLRRQIGLGPIPEEDTSTSLPPPIPPRNPARGTHYAYMPTNVHALDSLLNKSTTQKKQVHRFEQQGSCVRSLVTDTGAREQAAETPTSREKTVEVKSTRMSPSVSMSNLSDAIDSALQDWTELSTHK